MLNFIKNFAKDESGAVTVDWVVLTAAIVGLGIAIMTTVGGATADLGDLISGSLATQGIATY
ncbi:Flp family type IVb pilin [Pseudohalocynthiibacter aestuariivivens]|jgi:Flp pilus assembly pilin Flp|uniref:Flp family type IVb pilin n=2 Tax=Pseudohalocynthiibacter aestuariivivens TaxID=1591409 RepID=A0ABV5JBP9_9RHOB|nr:MULTISPECIES: hypothetical protein [Pseudohalocynthiibacter]MBS9718697.1 hypothetical protein [Pseudohalocynthiibacter aestuariivivens]MCK0104173.1 hypothetical protein [Pseudohalocynthiibacter sp. F2068]MCK0104174.1 hypothetical protein [Pseudohalocynthiibacter sp. F2068]